MLGGLSLPAVAQEERNNRTTNTTPIVTEENNIDQTPHGIQSNTHRGTHTGKFGTDHYKRNGGMPDQPHYGSGTDYYSTNTVDFDTVDQSSFTGRGTMGLRPGVGEDEEIRIKEDDDEIKIKMEQPGSQIKVEIDKNDNTMRVTTDRVGEDKTKVEYNIPSWVATHGYRFDKHVYFPDLHTFYQPGRGYVYWNNGTWHSSMTTPSFLEGVDLNTVRVQMIDDIELNTAPETEYIRLRTAFPAQPVMGVQIQTPEVE